jgi:excisionase family DNA binding protein
MQGPKRRVKLLLSDQERLLLVDDFPRFLATIERQGAGFAELQVLLGILQSLRESGGTHEVFETLLARVMVLLKIVVPDQLTLEEAANIYSVNSTTLRRACWTGKLPGEKQGKVWLVKSSDVEQYLARTRRRRSQ